MEIGEKILHYRTSLGLTQEQVAKKLNTTPQNIYKYEKGIIKNIPLQSIVIMSELFGVSPAELAGIAEIRTSETASAASAPSSEKLAFGVRLRSKREERGMSVRELALKLHILPSIVESYESGNFESIDDVRVGRIAEILDVSPDYFKSADISEIAEELSLTEDERLLILKYRVNPQYHSAIRQLLGISPHDAPAPSDGTFSYSELTPTEYDTLQPRAHIAQDIGNKYNTDKKD